MSNFSVFKQKKVLHLVETLLFLKDGQDEFLKTRILDLVFTNKLWDKADKEKFQRNPEKK
jgi:hypothetical protein